MRRRSSLKASSGTVWPVEVREHVRVHQAGCIGPIAGMPGHCDGETQLDHVRASHAVGMKSKSIATNAARVCNWHHDMKTRQGKLWRPRLLSIMRALIRNCDRCEQEWAREYGLDCGHVEPVHGCPDCRARRLAVPA